MWKGIKGGRKSDRQPLLRNGRAGRWVAFKLSVFSSNTWRLQRFCFFFSPFKLPSTLHISKPWMLPFSFIIIIIIFLSSKPAWTYVCFFLFLFFFLLYVTYLKPWMQYYTPFKFPFFFLFPFFFSNLLLLLSLLFFFPFFFLPCCSL